MGHVPPNIFTFYTTPMGVAWKESTPEVLCPPQYSEAGERLSITKGISSMHVYLCRYTYNVHLSRHKLVLYFLEGAVPRTPFARDSADTMARRAELKITSKILHRRRIRNFTKYLA